LEASGVFVTCHADEPACDPLTPGAVLDTFTVTFPASAADCTMATLTADTTPRPAYSVATDMPQTIDAMPVAIQPDTCGMITYFYAFTGPNDTDFMVYDATTAPV